MEVEGERKLVKKPVRVICTSNKEKLDVASRVNYSKLYTVEHNLKVCFIGEIDKAHEHRIFTAVENTLEVRNEEESEVKSKDKKNDKEPKVKSKDKKKPKQ